MMHDLFTTQEIGSLQRPIWRQKLSGPHDRASVASALLWGERLGVDERAELANGMGSGLLQKGGELTQAEKGRIIDISTLYAIRMQELAGLDRVFNGEQPRTEMYDFMARFVDGIEPAGTLNAFDANYFRKGTVRSGVSITAAGKAFFVDEFGFVRKHTRRVPKPCLTGPYTMADWSYLEYYRTAREAGGEKGGAAISGARRDAVLDFAANVLNPAVTALAKAGAQVIQIDEPAAATNENESLLFVEAINASFKSIPAGIEKAVHLCYSNYASLFPALADCIADSYLIEFTNHASPENFKPEEVDRGTFKALQLFREYKMKAKIGVGVIDIHSDLIETPQVVRDRILYAAKVLGDPGRVQVNPDCGLRTRRWNVAFAKLCSMAEGAALARAEFGEG
jgi:5-methyltetrahydropteroyltriglutamate--homocysteine methyltransferase